MRNNIKIIFLIAIALVVLSLFIGHFLNLNKSNSDSPFNYDLNDFKAVDEQLISHKEYKQISLNKKQYIDIDYYNEKIFILCKDALQVIQPDGNELFSLELKENPSAFRISKDGNVYVCFENYIIGYNENEWDKIY